MDLLEYKQLRKTHPDSKIIVIGKDFDRSSGFDSKSLPMSVGKSIIDCGNRNKIIKMTPSYIEV